jgi:hypothetical protein
MPALSKQVREAMVANISILHERRMCLYDDRFTHLECLELTTPKEHHEILISAALIAESSASEGIIAVQVPAILDGCNSPYASFYMRTHNNPPLRPRQPYWQLGVNTALECRAMTYLTHRLEHGRMAATATYVLDYLSTTCDTSTQLRYLLPAIMHLCEDQVHWDGEKRQAVQDWARKHAHYKPVRSTPAFTIAFRQAIRATSEWITTCALLPKDIGDRAMPRAEATLDLYGVPDFVVAGETLCRQ